MNLYEFKEEINHAIESTIEILQGNDFYIQHQILFNEGYEKNDIQKILEAQMTLHNMELEAVYHAGHCDCLQYLAHVNAIKNE